MSRQVARQELPVPLLWVWSQLPAVRRPSYRTAMAQSPVRMTRTALIVSSGGRITDICALEEVTEATEIQLVTATPSV